MAGPNHAGSLERRPHRGREPGSTDRTPAARQEQRRWCRPRPIGTAQPPDQRPANLVDITVGGIEQPYRRIDRARIAALGDAQSDSDQRMLIRVKMGGLRNLEQLQRAKLLAAYSGHQRPAGHQVVRGRQRAKQPAKLIGTQRTGQPLSLRDGQRIGRDDTGAHVEVREHRLPPMQHTNVDVMERQFRDPAPLVRPAIKSTDRTHSVVNRRTRIGPLRVRARAFQHPVAPSRYLPFADPVPSDPRLFQAVEPVMQMLAIGADRLGRVAAPRDGRQFVQIREGRLDDRHSLIDNDREVRRDVAIAR